MSHQLMKFKRELIFWDKEGHAFLFNNKRHSTSMASILVNFYQFDTSTYSFIILISELTKNTILKPLSTHVA
jgi:hypothetical protein